MEQLVQIEDLNEKQALKSQCRFIDEALDTDVYALLDNGDPKSVFTLKRIGDYTQPISTIRQLDFETRVDARGHNYATKGFEQILKVIQERADISEVYIDAANPISGKIAERFGLESTEMGRYLIKNPNFDINYETVCDMIKNGVPLEQIQTFSEQNGLSINQVNRWIEIQSSLPQLDKTEPEIPIFMPPEVQNSSHSKNDNEYRINEYGEIERPMSRLETLAEQKHKLQTLLQTKEVELNERQANNRRRDTYEKE